MRHLKPKEEPTAKEILAELHMTKTLALILPIAYIYGTDYCQPILACGMAFSLIVFFMLVIASLLLCLLRPGNPGILKIIAHAILPVELHLSLYFLGTTARVFIIVLYSIAAVITLIDYLCENSFFRHCSFSVLRNLPLRRWSVFYLGRGVIIWSLVLLLIVVPIIQQNSPSDEIVPAQNTSESPDSEWTICNQMEVLQNLDEDRWATLSEQERLDVLNVVCRIEARYLGIEPIKLSAENMPAGKRGATHWTSAEVVLNRKDLKTASSFDMLVAAIHESFHVYQHDLVLIYDQLDDSQRDLLCFRAVGVYKAEAENYITAVEDADAYMSQSLEQAAMCYSYDGAIEYLDAVAEYLNSPDTVE